MGIKQGQMTSVRGDCTVVSAAGSLAPLFDPQCVTAGSFLDTMSSRSKYQQSNGRTLNVAVRTASILGELEHGLQLRL